MSSKPTHDHSDHQALAGIRSAFFLNLGFSLIELIGGVLTNSLAILSDALHDLGDSLVIGLSWYLERHAHKPGSAAFSYGLRRLSLLAALVNAVVLVSGSVLILSLALPRLLNPEPANAAGMFGLALLGIIVNGAAVLRVRSGKTLNEQVLTWHLLEDVLGWVAVLLASVVLLVSELHILDPLLSILITGFLLYKVLGRLRKTMEIFLQAVPDAVDLPAIEAALAAIPGVLHVHHTHIWSLDGARHVFTTHLVVPADSDRQAVLAIKQQALALPGLDPEHSTIEIEYAGEHCHMRGASP